MLYIGDLIETPKYYADGTTVKAENFNRTITAVPAYAPVSDAYINRCRMVNSGGRSIKRAIYVDASGVKFYGDDTIKRIIQ